MPKGEKKRKFCFGDKKGKAQIEIRIIELFTDYGLHVWPGGILLSEYLFNNPDICSNKTVLELGSGVGLPGLLAGKIGAKSVYLSDASRFETILKNMDREIELNDLSGNCQSVGLTWGRFNKSSISLKPDIVIGADVFYDENDFEDILCNVQFYLNRGASAFYTVIHNRGYSRPLGSLLLKWQMNVKEIDCEHIIMNSDYLSLNESTKLMLVQITSAKQSAHTTHASMRSVLGLIGTGNGTPSPYARVSSLGLKGQPGQRASALKKSGKK